MDILSSTQQMRKSIQVQFKLVLHPSSSYATPAPCILLGCWAAGQAQLDGKVKLSAPDEAWLYIRTALSEMWMDS